MSEKEMKEFIWKTSHINRLHHFGGELSILGMIMLTGGLLFFEVLNFFLGIIWTPLGLLFIGIGLDFTNKAKKIRRELSEGDW